MDALTQFYNTTSCHNYILAVNKGGRVKAYFVTLDRAGYGVIFNEKPTMAKRQMVVKYRSTIAKIEYLEAHAEKVIDLMTIDELKAARRVKINRKGKPYTENCGECFEWLMAEYLGARQNDKANLKHTEGGDIAVSGRQWQVKYEKGAITVGV